MGKKLEDLDELFKGRHVERELIILCVRWYRPYKLYRDQVEMMIERCTGRVVSAASFIS
jgi:transposase-like protein